METWMSWLPSFLLGLTLLALFGLALAVGVFLALRWLFLWYWRVNEQVALLHEIRDLLREDALAAWPPALPASAPVPPAALDSPEDAVTARLRRLVPTPAEG